MRTVLILLISVSSFSAFAISEIGNPSARKIKENLLDLARQKQVEADRAREAVRYVEREPFLPQKYDYGFELGGALSQQTLYSLGGSMGFHLGPCVFSDSQSCQQYFDLIGDVNGRESYTHYLGMASLRWQWVNFPSSWSPLARIVFGGDNAIVPSGVNLYPTYGIGIGVTTYLHPKADIRIEYRIYQSDQIYHQIMFSVMFKMERWVEFFAEKLKDIGVGTAEVTGSVVKGTAGVVGGAAEFTGIKQKDEPKKQGP